MQLPKLLTALFLSFIFTTFAYAAPILWIDDLPSGKIGTVDVTTGIATVIGNSGVGLTDIAFDPSGNLYGVSFNALYSINKTTGTATSIGSLGVNDVNGLVFNSNGTLYASGLSGELYSVNTTTGSATGLFNTGHSSGGDLAFFGGTLYYTDAFNLISVDLAGKTATTIGAIGASPVYGLAAGDDGKLYGAANSSIYLINPSTGAGSLVSSYANGLGQAGGTAFFKEAAVVPLPPALWLFGSGLVGILGFRGKNAKI